VEGRDLSELYSEYLIAANQDFDLRFACFWAGAQIPNGRPDLEAQGTAGFDFDFGAIFGGATQ
jgi:hypothetical protein